MKELRVSRDEFQEVTCGITGQACYWHDCSDCKIGLERAKENALYNERMDIMEDIEDLTNFSRDIRMGSLEGKCNRCNTVAKFSNASVDALCKTMMPGDFKKCTLKEEVPYMDILYPEWSRCRVYNALPNADFYMYAKDWPLVAVYPECVYVTSPVIPD